MSPEPVGRSVELSALRAFVGEPGCAVVVHGEAGVGKTTLVAHVMSPVDHLVGGALATLSWSPYFVWRRALGDLVPEHDWNGDPEFVSGVVVAAAAGRAVVLEDLQWADPQSRRVVGMVVGRVSLVTTVRQGDPAAAAVLAELDDAGVARLDLEPLAAADASDLARRLRPDVTGARLERLVQRSGGNPLLIEELSRGDAEPDSLRLAIAARLRPLSEEAREGVALLALADRALPETSVPGATELLAAGLVEGRDGELAVRHALLAEVARDLLSEERTMRCHRTLARLVGHPGDAARHHLAVGDLAQAHAAALVAVEQASTPGERATHLATAAISSVGIEGVRLRLRAARAAVDAFDIETAAELLEGVPDVPELRAAIELTRGQITYAQGDYEGWRASAVAAVAAAEPGSHDWVEALVEQAAVRLFIDEDPVGATPLAEGALDEARRIGAHVAYATNVVAMARYFQDDPNALEIFAEALRAARAEGNLQVERSAANNLISCHVGFGSPVIARALAAEMVKRGEELRLGGWRSHFTYWELNLALHAGDHDVVQARAPDVLEQAPLLNTRQELGAALAASQVQTGRIREALQTCATHLGGDAGRARGNLHATLALAHLVAGEPARALAERDAFVAGNNDPHNATMAAPIFAWAAYEAGEDAPADPDGLVDRGILAGVGPELAGISLLREGRLVEAAECFGAAAEAYAGFDLHRELWSAWAAGDALGRAGETGEATRLLQDVEERAEVRGMTPMVARTRGSLRALGVRRTGSGAARGSGLSDREQEVVGLVAEGLSDKEIAGRLGVSPRTVESHVESARRKLGAANRRQLLGGLRDSG